MRSSNRQERRGYQTAQQNFHHGRLPSDIGSSSVGSKAKNFFTTKSTKVYKVKAVSNPPSHYGFYAFLVVDHPFFFPVNPLTLSVRPSWRFPLRFYAPRVFQREVFLEARNPGLCLMGRVSSQSPGPLPPFQ